MNKPHVTVLMTAYNTEKFIEKAIESVLCQTDGDFLFYIRNNGSNDQTGELCEKFASSDKRIRYLKNKVNYVLDNADDVWWPEINSEYVCILDSDDYLEKNFIELMYKAAKENDADLTACGSRSFADECPSITACRIPPEITTKDMSSLRECFTDLYGTLRTVWGKFYKTSFYYKWHDFAYNTSFSLKSGYDTYIFLGYMQKCNSFVTIGKPLYNYRIRQNSTSRTNICPKFKLNEAKIILKRGMDFLHSIKIDSRYNIDSLYLVHFSAVKYLLKQMKDSSEMSIDEIINYLDFILRDDTFSGYALAEGAKEETTKLLLDYINDLFPDETLLIQKGKCSYLCRLCLCKREIDKNSVNILTFPRVLSVLCDKSNKHLIGEEFLEYKWSGLSQNIKEFSLLSKKAKKDAFKNRVYIRDVFSKSDNEEELIRLKEKINKLIDEEKEEEAINLLNEISSGHALDADCLINRIYLSYRIGDIAFALDTANIALVFWSGNEYVDKICNDLFRQTKSLKEGVQIEG